MHPITEDNGIAAAHRLMREQDPEPSHAEQVCRTSLSLFDQTKEIHGLGAEERRLLEAGALLHDIGYAKGAAGHHKASRDAILVARLEGFTAVELRIIACLARYHRKADPKPSHKVYCDLPESLRSVVCKLAALLRIADGLDRSHDASAQALRVEREGKKVRIWVSQEPVNELDIWGAERKRGLFESVYGCSVRIRGE